MSRLGVSALLALLFCAAPAAAQSVRLDQYRMAETANDGFALSRPNDIGHVAFGARLDIDYAFNPLVYQTRLSDASTEVTSVVEHLLAAQLGVSFGLFDRFVLYVGLPINLWMDGTQVAGQPRADGASLGDISFGLRGRLFGESRDAFALALQVTGTAPTARAARFQSRFAGEGGWAIHPELLFEVRITEYVRVTGNAGALVREEQDFGSLRVGHEFTWGGALTVAAVPNTLELMIESYGATAFDRFAQTQVSPVELLGGVRVLPIPGLSVGAAAGGGLVRGYGAGDLRAIFSIGYATPEERPIGDRDGDGLTDDVDQCPDEPEDVDRFEDEDGCPDPDNDGDLILDPDDECPGQAEDMDGLGDEDGCPEQDFDGDGVNDDTDRCPREAGVASPARPDCTGCPTCEEAPPPQPIVQREPEPEPPPEQEQEGPRVYFDVDSYAVRPSQRRALDEVLRYLQTHPDAHLMVEGHADYRGTEPSNRILSRQRARRVMTWFRLRGVDRSRMSGAGCGERYPAEANETRRGRQANRRVELRTGGPQRARADCSSVPQR